MLDVLPECLIHKILSCLTFIEVAKLSILSKTWPKAWLTYVNLDFAVDNLNAKVVDYIMKKHRDEKIHIEKFVLSDCSGYSCNEVFPMFDMWLDIALENGVKYLVFGCAIPTSYPLPMFKILAPNSLRELVLYSCDLKRALLSSGVVNSNSLRKLSLRHVDLDQNLLQTLINSCPFITSFILDNCSGLEKIEILNLQKIKSVTIWKSNIYQHVKIHAPTLEHFSCYSTDRDAKYQHIPELDIIDAPNLLSLEYKGDEIPATFVDANLQWSCHPRELKIDSTRSMIAHVMDRLMYMKSSSQLKEVQADIYDWENRRWHHVELGSGMVATRAKYRFLLDW
ncbi:hypothetical protein P3S67_001749 [Capsicum chacoense]